MRFKHFFNGFAFAREIYKFNLLFSVEKHGDDVTSPSYVRLVLVAWYHYFDFSFPIKNKRGISFDIGARPITCRKTWPWTKED